MLAMLAVLADGFGFWSFLGLVPQISWSWTTVLVLLQSSPAFLWTEVRTWFFFSGFRTCWNCFHTTDELIGRIFTGLSTQWEHEETLELCFIYFLEIGSNVPGTSSTVLWNCFGFVSGSLMTFGLSDDLWSLWVLSLFPGIDSCLFYSSSTWLCHRFVFGQEVRLCCPAAT